MVGVDSFFLFNYQLKHPSPTLPSQGKGEVTPHNNTLPSKGGSGCVLPFISIITYISFNTCESLNTQTPLSYNNYVESALKQTIFYLFGNNLGAAANNQINYQKVHSGDF